MHSARRYRLLGIAPAPVGFRAKPRRRRPRNMARFGGGTDDRRLPDGTCWCTHDAKVGGGRALDTRTARVHPARPLGKPHGIVHVAVIGALAKHNLGDARLGLDGVAAVRRDARAEVGSDGRVASAKHATVDLDEAHVSAASQCVAHACAVAIQQLVGWPRGRADSHGLTRVQWARPLEPVRRAHARKKRPAMNGTQWAPVVAGPALVTGAPREDARRSGQVWPADRPWVVEAVSFFPS